MRRFGKPRKPFFIIVSRDDKALRFSDFIAGGKERLGAYTNDAELTALGAVVIDMTNVKADRSQQPREIRTTRRDCARDAAGVGRRRRNARNPKKDK